MFYKYNIHFCENNKSYLFFNLEYWFLVNLLNFENLSIEFIFTRFIIKILIFVKELKYLFVLKLKMLTIETYFKRNKTFVATCENANPKIIYRILS